MENKHTLTDLLQMQSLSLPAKIRMTEYRINQWVDEYGIDGVYVSFSGGKDSAVLLDIARKLYPNIRGAFIDTGLEYPQIREFVKQFDGIDWLKPELTFRQVIEKYGYPLPSKEIAMHVYNTRAALKRDGIDITKHLGWMKLNGLYFTKDGEKSHYNCEKWKFLLDSPFLISPRCCDISKKSPAKKYEKKTGRKPIIATLATESKQRETIWMKQGCNAFNVPRPISTPMAFWTEQDVLHYIKENNLPIASVYGEIVEDDSESVNGQLSLFGDPVCKLKTTGCDRTGCTYCLFGAHLPENPRFEELKKHQPKIYEFIMKPLEAGGLGYKEVIDWLNEHGKLNIKY